MVLLCLCILSRLLPLAPRLGTLPIIEQIQLHFKISHVLGVQFEKLVDVLLLASPIAV